MEYAGRYSHPRYNRHSTWGAAILLAATVLLLGLILYGASRVAIRSGEAGIDVTTLPDHEATLLSTTSRL